MNATLFGILRTVSFALSGAFLITAIILFFKLRIKGTIDELSGRKSRKQVAEFRKENASNKSRGYIPGIFKENNVVSTAAFTQSEKLKRSTSKLTARLTEDEPDIPESGGTVLLSANTPYDDYEEGTALLSQPSEEGTTLLNEEEGTTLLTDAVENGKEETVACNVIREVILAESKEFIKVD